MRQETVRFPAVEPLFLEMIKSLAVDSGIVTTSQPVGSNILQDSKKNWQADIHRNRLVKIVSGAGAGQVRSIRSNGPSTLVIEGTWAIALGTTSAYVILDVGLDLGKLDVALSTRATEATLAKLMPTAATKYAVTMTNANTEYSQALPANTKKFRIHLRDWTGFRLAYETGKVATPTDPYETIPDGAEKYEEELNLASHTLYFASAAAGKTAEIEAWS